MHVQLRKFEHNQEGRHRADKIYRMGGFSRSVVDLQLKHGLTEDLPKGTLIKGNGMNTDEVITAVVAYGQKAGDETIRVLYNQDVPCHVGGLPKDIQETDGCFESPGSVSFISEETGQRYTLDYTYDTETGNINERTIHSMSANAARKFKRDGLPSRPYFHDFQKFVDYYGEPDFADKMVTAAMNAESYTFHSGSFDFSESTKEARSDFIELFSKYLNIGLFMINELENALEKCANHCQHGDCHHAAIHALDAAVAFYVGSLQAEDPKKEGNLLYSLANHMCVRFRTCGLDGDEAEGTAKVNYDIFEEFNDMRDNLTNDKCVDAQKNKEAIVKHMFIPMFQGFRFAVYRRTADHNWGDTYLVEDAAPFTAAVMPLLGYCHMDEANEILVNFSPGNVEETEDLATIEQHLNEHYECMGFCCHDIGGLWHRGRKEYHRDAGPCEETWAHCVVEPEVVVEEDPSRTWMIWVFLIGVSVTGGLWYRRRLRAIKRRKRAEATGEYEDGDDSDDDSEEMHRFT